MEQRVARQEIEAATAGDPEARRKALIEYEHQLEMEAIAAREGISEEEKRTLQDLAERSRDLQIADTEKEATKKTTQVMQQVTTHSAAAAQAAGFMGSSSPQEKTVQELKQVVSLAREQLKIDREIIAAHERFYAAMTYG
jgi:hypothetical protein